MVWLNKKSVNNGLVFGCFVLFITFIVLAATIAPVYAVSCQLSTFSVDRTTASVGETFTISAGGSCDTGVRAIRVFVDGNIIYELGTTDITATWVAAGEGTHSIRAEIAGQTDDNWTQSTSQSTDVTVTGSPPAPVCQVNAPGVSPNPGRAGSVFTISASGSCDTGVRAIRIKINGNIIYELGSPDVTATWDSTGSPDGTYTATAEIAGQGDNEWNHLASASTQFTVGSGGQNSPTCTANSINITPSNGTSGTVFTISASGSCTPPVRAIRIKINENIIYELGAPQVSATWNSSGSPDGVYIATAEVAGEGDNNWNYAASISKQFTVGNPVPTPAPPANPPVCTIDPPVVLPSSGPIGTVFTISANGSCNTGVRAIRIEVNGQGIYELGAPQVSATWNSSDFSDGVYRATAVIAGQGDNDWGAAQNNSTEFAVGSATLPAATAVPSSSGSTGTGSPSSPSGNDGTNATGGCYYTVQPNDTLFRIGRAFGISHIEIARQNGIANPDRIFAGWRLFIPKPGCISTGDESSNPSNPTPSSPSDTDSDGVPDASDNCPNNANSGQENTFGDHRGDSCEPPLGRNCTNQNNTITCHPLVVTSIPSYWDWIYCDMPLIMPPPGFIPPPGSSARVVCGIDLEGSSFDPFSGIFEIPMSDSDYMAQSNATVTFNGSNTVGNACLPDQLPQSYGGVMAREGFRLVAGCVGGVEFHLFNGIYETANWTLTYTRP